MDYLFFEKSAIEVLVSKIEYQTTEYSLGNQFMQVILDNKNDKLDGLYVKNTGKGIIFSGKGCEKSFLLFDLQQSNLLEKENDKDCLLLIFQKTFRTAIRIWNQHPFTSSEKIHESKSIIFPFAYYDRRRVVIERQPNAKRLEKRGISHSLLAYKYGVEDAPRYEEIPEIDNFVKAGEEYLGICHEIISYFSCNTAVTNDTQFVSPLVGASTSETVSDGGFRYMKYEYQLNHLTSSQESVVNNTNITSPIRVEGPAGTGKTASMILRAYRLLQDAKKENRTYRIAFFCHSESTRIEIENSFNLLENATDFTSGDSEQRIIFTTLLSYCIETTRLGASQILESDANEAKLYQRLMIEDALSVVMDAKYKTYKPLLSKSLNQILSNYENNGALVLMLQHEFSVQIKGRTDCSIEEYRNLPPIKNALPVETEKDKDFIFHIFLKYQEMLSDTHAYDNDDITVEALTQWNAPIWRRQRSEKGFDYIFVDEMHLFNLNEQYAFHYLTKSNEQKDIPICFALDYSQAIGDRGDVQQDYIEKTFCNASISNYKTVFRSSQQITDFCAAISASGALVFQSDYRNPYNTPASGFTQQEESLCSIPKLFMYDDDDKMIESLKLHIDECKRDLQCKNHEIALISFDPLLLSEPCVTKLRSIIVKPISVINKLTVEKTNKQEDPIILADPYSVNGLEYSCVILIGVDEGRVPQTKDTGDISQNYIKYSAFNQLYLTSSRAKYRLIVLGNKLHGVSSCLKYALETNCIEECCMP